MNFERLAPLAGAFGAAPFRAFGFDEVIGNVAKSRCARNPGAWLRESRSPAHLDRVHALREPRRACGVPDPAKLLDIRPRPISRNYPLPFFRAQILRNYPQF